MSTRSSLYTMSLPKRSNVTGAKDQAFGHNKDFLAVLVGAIQAKTVAAIGMVLPFAFQCSMYVVRRVTLTWPGSRWRSSVMQATSLASSPW